MQFYSEYLFRIMQAYEGMVKLMKSVWDEYKHTSGSIAWPSTDPKDSLFDSFICKQCGEELYLRISSPSEWAEAALRAHLLEHCSQDFLQRNVHTDMLKAGPAFDILLLQDLKQVTRT